MLILVGTTDKIELVSDAAATLDVHASYVDATAATGAVSNVGRQATAITTATTTDIVAAGGSGVARNVKTINIRNKHASLACGVTVQVDISGTNYELHRVTLLAGECLEYIESVGWFVIKASRLDRWLRVGTAYVNATTSFTDITGLTCPVDSGKTYNFEAHLIHANNASTTGSRFGINGPTLSNIRGGIIDTVTNSVSASVHAAGGATAVDTSLAGATTTGSTADRLAILSGVFTTGAAGTFAMRGASEVAVAAGLTVRAGSWCHLWEATG